MIILYHAPMSRSTRVLWLLEELAADYALRPVSIRRPDGRGAPDPDNPHPLKQVPAIDHDGALIVESLAIWLYLSDLFPEARMAPQVGGERRRDYMSLMGAATAVFEPLVVTVMKGAQFSPREAAARQQLDCRLSAALEDAPFLFGPDFSTADLVYASLLRFFPAALPDRPCYQDWLDRIAMRPALARAREKDAARQACGAKAGG